MHKIVMFAVFLLLPAVSVFGQVTGMQTDLTKDMLKEESSKLTQKNDLFRETIPVGNLVDPEHYVCGPGDIYSLRVLPNMITDEYLSVSPEGNLILPRGGGAISTLNKTIAKVKKEIEAVYQKINPKTQVIFSLTKPRLCIIKIEGNVNFPGSYTLPASFRISTAIEYSNKPDQIAMSNLETSRGFFKYQESLKNKQKDGNIVWEDWKRNVIVTSKDGKSSVVDLIRATTTGDLAEDPFIREGNVIFVPFGGVNKNGSISITGAVVKPSSIPYRTGDKVSHLLKMGTGVLPDADLNEIYLVREGVKTKLSVDENLELQGEDTELGPGCQIIIGRQKSSGNTRAGVVSVVGEVNNPGSYSIVSGQTTVREVLEFCGGITESASFTMSNIMRKSNIDAKTIDIKRKTEEYYVNSNLTVEDSLRLKLAIDNIEPLVSFDLERLIKEKEYNVILEDGDVISIPRKSKSIYVFGAVNFPGFVEYKEGKMHDWYLNKAGGITSEEYQERIRVIRGPNKQWYAPEEEFLIKDGDQIYVAGEKDVPVQAQDAKNAFYVGLINAAISFGFIIIQVINLMQAE